jgi:predicted transcriptional regulator
LKEGQYLFFVLHLLIRMAKKKKPAPKSPSKTSKVNASKKVSKAAKTPPASKKVPPKAVKKSSATKKAPPKKDVKQKVPEKPKESPNSKDKGKKPPIPKKPVKSSKTTSESKNHHHKPISSTESNVDQDKVKKKNYSEIDKDLLALIVENETIFIHEIEQTLGLSQEEVKKALKRLEQRGKIQTHAEMNQGKWQIEAKIVDNYGLDSQIKKKVPNSTHLIWGSDDIPCYLCPNVKKCKAGQEELNPQNCPELTKWVEAQMQKKEYINPYRNQVKDIK